MFPSVFVSTKCTITLSFRLWAIVPLADPNMTTRCFRKDNLDLIFQSRKHVAMMGENDFYLKNKTYKLTRKAFFYFNIKYRETPMVKHIVVTFLKLSYLACLYNDD